MTIKHRVQFTIATSILLFMVLGLLLYVTGRRVRGEIAKSRLSADIGRAASDLHLLTSDYVMNSTPTIRRQWENRYARITELLADAAFDSQDEQRIIRHIRDAHEGMQPIFLKLTAAPPAAEETAVQPESARMDEMLRKRLVGQLLVINHGMMSGVFELDESARTGIAQAQRHAMQVALGCIPVATLLVLGVGLLTLSSLIRRTGRLTSLATQIAGGDLTVEVPAERSSDEIGILTGSFKTMAQSLRRQSAELRKAAGFLGTAASNISSSVAQVTACATETAAALSETASTVEELKQTADVSSQKARQVSAVADAAAETSVSGEVAAKRVADEIGHIKLQMTSISSDLMRLSEQGEDISEIIGAVDDLAEQSNLLAVNAAIEAAKAGEHGRGFAVVAEEIKSLAEQSKDATRRVRTILGDIQKATSAAVMAAEQGHKAVNTAVREAAEAGSSIQALAESIERAAEAATQIAASSHEQMIGVDQVATAMDHIKQAANQNVDGMRQLEVASRGLQDLSDQLVAMLQRYRD